jgi:hypothetical protein
MGKYTTYTPEKQNNSKEPHSIWSGLGCLLMIIIPVISYAAASLTVDALSAPGYRVIPTQLMGKPRLPDFVYNSKGLIMLLTPLTKVNNLYANLVVGFFYVLLISGVIAVIYAIVYSSMGPRRYGPTDSPPLRYKKTSKPTKPR